MNEPFSFHPIDWAILIAFAVLQVFIGVRLTTRPGRGEQQRQEDFLLDGRRLTMPVFVASLVSTWYGGILGVGEYTYKHGISNWLVFGVPYYVWAAVFALAFAAKARRSRFVSISDHLYDRYGRAAGLVGTAFVFVMTVPAVYVLMLGVMFRLFFGWPLWAGVTLGALLAVAHVYLGGFRSVVRTDVLQFVLMFGGFAVILPFALFQHGGWEFLTANLPATHFTWHGGKSLQYVLVWYIIATTTLIEPAFYERCYAAKNERVARRGILISIFFWCLFDFMTTSAGLYARAILPQLKDPVAAFPVLGAAVLPPAILGLFLVGLFATVISTVDSYAFLSAIALGRDMIWRNLKVDASHNDVPWIRFGLWVSAALAIGLAMLSQSAVDLWHDLGTIGCPALVVPMLATFSDRWRLPPRWATISMVVSGGTSLVWLLWGRLSAEGYPLGLEPIIPGLILSLAFFLLWRERMPHAISQPMDG